MWCAPEQTKDGNVGMWYFGRESYHEKYTEESMKDLNTYWPATIHSVLKLYTQISRFTIAVYDRGTKELLSVYGAPESDSP